MPPLAILGLGLLACPLFIEFFPDPSDVPDAIGEFIELNLSPESKDTLWIQQEDKEPIPFYNLKGNRLLLHRDTTGCPPLEGLACELMEFSALPNSRSSIWNLKQGECYDTAYLPIPKSGKSLQRVDSTYSAWEYTEPTKGKPNGIFAPGMVDCRIELLEKKYDSKKYEIKVSLLGCDSASASYEWTSLDFIAKKQSGKTIIKKEKTFSLISEGEPKQFKLALQKDDFPENDTLEVLLLSKEKSPLSITEIHFCPSEGFSEWVELYNNLPVILPMEGFSFCQRSEFNSPNLLPYESIILGKDTSNIREEIGFKEVQIIKSNFGSLKNTQDTLCLCHLKDTLQCVEWGSEEGDFCPYGFNPLTHRKENTPGVQNRRNNEKSKETPFTIETNKRIISKNRKEELRLKIQGDVPVSLYLSSENGTLLWQHKESAPNGQWIYVPLIKYTPGIYFLKCSSGAYEKNIGVVLRP